MSNGNLADFIKLIPGKSVGESQRELQRLFWEAVAQLGIRKWRRGDPYRLTGRYVLIGLAVYSVYDLRLARAIVDRNDTRSATPAVEFFDSSDVTDMEDMQRYIPGIGQVYQTPVVGVWQDAVLVEKASGFAGRKLVERELALPHR